MLKVVIKASSEEWKDHAGNLISELVFSKENNSEAGHYALESYGKLDRTIDDFRKSSLQSLSDWEISLPSVFSDGNFQMVDLLYWLEAVNGANFDLTGSEAILYDGEDEIFRCVVSSTATGNLRSDIRFSERMGTPEIEASFFPTAIGDESLDKWEVRIAKKYEGFEIVYSDRALTGDPKFFVYIEKIDKYIPVEFLFGAKEDNSLSFILLPQTDSIVGLGSPIPRGDPIFIPGPTHATQTDLKTLIRQMRPESDKAEPDSVLVGGERNHGRINSFEFAEAWSNYHYEQPNGKKGYMLGRTTADYHTRAYGASIPISIITNPVKIKFTVEYPISSMTTGSELLDMSWLAIQTSGSLHALRDISAKNNNEQISQDDWDIVPTIKFNSPYPDEYIHVFPLNLNFAVDLPSTAKVTDVKIGFKMRRQGTTTIHFWIGENNITHLNVHEDLDGQNWTWYAIPMEKILEKIQNLSANDFNKITFKISRGSYRTGTYAIAGVRLALELTQPLEDVKKLYASGEFYEQPSEGNEEESSSVEKAVQMLLKAAGVTANVSVIGEITNNLYGTVMRNESHLLRDKLRSLAAESGTLIKFSPTENKIFLQSISRTQTHGYTEIPISAFLLSNNMYSFKMESPDRNDIASGVVISWGKDYLTGNYKHILRVDKNGIYKDGEELYISNTELKNEWDSVLVQLQKNIGTIKNLDTEWIVDWKGAESMAYDYLCWNSAPLRKAQAVCITPEIKNYSIDIGAFVRFALPGYPQKFAETFWVVIGMQDDLDGHITNLELLEVWDMPTALNNRFLLLENGENILLENEDKIKLEDFSGAASGLKISQLPTLPGGVQEALAKNAMLVLAYDNSNAKIGLAEIAASAIGTDTTNHLVYLGLLNEPEPTPEQLTEFAQLQAVTLFDSSEIETGYTVRDSQDRDWRWVDDGEAPPPPPPDNRMHDPKDGQYYDVIESGELFWTARNYAYGGSGIFYSNAGAEPFPQAGKLYSYAEAAANAPAGWRLPTQAELTALSSAAGTGSNLTANGSGSGAWQTSGSITHNNTIGFNLLPAGSANDASTFNYLSQRAYLWVDNQGVASGSMRAIASLYSSANLSTVTDRTSNHRLSVRYVREVS